MNSICILYLDTHGGDADAFQKNLEARQRFGQAFFNSLSRWDQELLRGTRLDPFYSNTLVYAAIDYLLEQRTVKK